MVKINWSYGFMDKVDLINRKKNIEGNLIKWWNVNMVDEMLVTSDIDIPGLPSGEYDDMQFEEDNQDELDMQNEDLMLANEIYERLLKEAAEDEDKKNAEIEEAKKLQEMG